MMIPMHSKLFVSRVLLAPICLAAVPVVGTAEALYPAEERVELAGYPAIAHFTAGDPDGPLVVFAPGAHHTARIAYGGHDGARDEDFLAHWLAERGINLLALSYPIETAQPVFDEAHPNFTAQDWGRQLAEGAAAAIEEHGLEGEVYLAAWSMAGKVIQPAHAAMRAEGLELAAPPPRPSFPW